VQIEKGLAATITSENPSIERAQTVTSKAPDPEVKEKAHRRQYSAASKLRILEELDRCSKPGEVGALLRREGLYSSNIIKWRRQPQAGQLKVLSPNKRGR
jgi:transposase-like protein